MKVESGNLNTSLIISYFVLVVIIFLSLFSILNLEITGGAVIGSNKVGIPLGNLSEELVNYSSPKLADPKEENKFWVPEKELVEAEPVLIEVEIVSNTTSPSFENEIEAFYVESPNEVSLSGALPSPGEFITLNSTFDTNLTGENLTVFVDVYAPEEEMVSYNLNFQKNSGSLGLANFPMDIEVKTITSVNLSPGPGVGIDVDYDIFDGGFGNDVIVEFFDPLDSYPDYLFSDIIAEGLPPLDWCAVNYPQCVSNGLFGFGGLIYGADEIMEMGRSGPIIMTGQERWFSQTEYQSNPLVVELVRDYTAYGLATADISGDSLLDLVTYSPTGFNSMDFNQPAHFQGRATDNGGRVSSNEEIRSLDGVHISGRIDFILGGAVGFQPGSISDLSDLTIVENFKQVSPISFWEMGSQFYFKGDFKGAPVWSIDPPGGDLTANQIANQINRRIRGLEYLNNVLLEDLDGNGEVELIYGSYNCGKNGQGCIFIVMDYILTDSFGSKKTFFNNHPDDTFYDPNYDVGCIPSYAIYCDRGDTACGRSITAGQFNGVGPIDLAFNSGTKSDGNDFVYIIEE